MIQISDNWSWTVCNLPLRQLSQGDVANPVIWPLKSAITLLHPKIDGPNPIINLSVESEKSFQLSDELGWNWHKSWKLPILSVQLELTDPETKETLLCPKDIYCQIFAVKASLDENKKLILTDVGLKGTTKMELVDGKGVFQTLKFTSTSYNNEGVKFHLVVCLYLQVSEDTPPKIFKSIISPPIFVDSRKSVKDAEKLMDNKLFVYMNPFSPDNFTKRFVKRETKKKESIEEDIQNNIEGFCSYLTAPNIRNKVKHPIFLSIRFSNCISLYYNRNDINAEVKPNFAEILQELFYKDIEKGNNLCEIKPEDSVFIMCIDLQPLEDKSKRKKVTESLATVRNRSLSLVFNKLEVPSHFMQLNELGSLMEGYSKSYSKIAKRAKMYMQDEENEEEDGPTEKLPPPDKQTLNFQQQKPPKRNEWFRYFDIHFPEENIQKKVKTDLNSNSPNALIEPLRSNSLMEPVKMAQRMESEVHISPGLFQKKIPEHNNFSPQKLSSPNLQAQPIFVGLLPNQHHYGNGVMNSPLHMAGQPVFLNNINNLNNIRGNVQLNNATSTFPQMVQLNNGQQIAIIPHNPYQQPQISPQNINLESGINRFGRPLVNHHQFGLLESHNRQMRIEEQFDAGFLQKQQSFAQNDGKMLLTKPMLLQLQEQALVNAIRSREQLQQTSMKETLMQIESQNNDLKVKNEEGQDPISMRRKLC